MYHASTSVNGTAILDLICQYKGLYFSSKNTETHIICVDVKDPLTSIYTVVRQLFSLLCPHLCRIGHLMQGPRNWQRILQINCILVDHCKKDYTRLCVRACMLACVRVMRVCTRYKILHNIVS